MSVSLTPSTVVTFPASLVAPVDGDDADAASVNVGAQSLLDAVEAARLMAYGGLSQKPLLRSVNGTTVVMASVPAVMATVGGTWRVVGPTGAQTFAVGDIDIGGIFLTSHRYYMYLKINGTGVTRVISSTAPDTYNKFKAGSTDYAYVGSFVTSSAPLVHSFAAAGGVYHYFHAGLLGNSPATTGPVTLDFAALGYLPASTTLAILNVGTLYNTKTSGVVNWQVGPADGTNADGYRRNIVLNPKYTNAASGTTNNVESGSGAFLCPTDTLQRVSYLSDDASYAGALYVEGYVEH